MGKPALLEAMERPALGVADALCVAGDLGAAVKLKAAHIGDTLCPKSSPVKIPLTDYPKPSIFSAIVNCVSST